MQSERKPSYDHLVDILGDVAVSLWDPDDLRGFSAAVWQAVFTDKYANELAPLPDGIPAFLRQLAEDAGAWPDADGVPCPLPGPEDM